MTPFLFRFGADTGLESVTGRLATLVGLRLSTPTAVNQVYLDTFDWRLHHAGLCLCMIHQGHNRSLHLWRIDNGRELARVPVKRPPVWPTELPEGVMRDTLASVSGPRALLRMADTRVEHLRLELRDDQDKLVGVAHARAGRVIPPFGGERPLPTSLECESLRGYEKAAQVLCDLLSNTPGVRRLDGDFRGLALAAAGRVPGDYDSRLNFSFDADQPADQALREIITGLTATLAANVDGIRQDRDTEFLHDFRVAVRRLRSLHKRFRGLLPAAARDALGAELQWLGSESGHLRDIDVLGLYLARRAGRLHPAAAPGIEALSARLRRRRTRVRDRFVATLGDARYRRLLQWLRDLAETTDWSANPEHDRPLGPLVADVILRLHRRVLKQGRAIDDASPAEDLHALRKRCKQLRYVLEMFASLYGDELREYIQALKRLQNLLGGFQDCSVHEQALLQLLADARRAPAVEEGLAVGGLLQQLHTRQHKLRRRFAERFGEFDTRPNNKRLRRVLRG